jgi:CRISPR-associated protein Csd1
MNSLESSPLLALTQLYDRLTSDPSYNISPMGYTAQKVSFCMVLSADGKLVAIQDARFIGEETNKPYAQLLNVPGQSAGAAIAACLLWGTSGYTLGYKTPDPKDPEKTAKALERVPLLFAAFREKHLALEQEINAPEYTTVCNFLRTWDPAEIQKFLPTIDEYTTSFGVFSIEGKPGYLHNLPAVAKYWTKTNTTPDPDAVIGQCLITGEENQPLARLVNPPVKGVRDASAMCAKIVSFNCPAFESYGLEQSYNSPMSQAAAFKHVTALNSLLAGPKSDKHRIQVGDSTTAFWTSTPTATEGFLAEFLEGFEAEKSVGAQDEPALSKLSAFLKVLRAGGGRELRNQLNDDPDTPFYMLGISPNVARLFIRFWRVSTLGETVDNLAKHYEDLRIDRPPGEHNPEFPALWVLLLQTAREASEISPSLAGPVMRAVLTGSHYPRVLVQSVIRRIRIDREVRYLRAAILKAFLNRNHDKKLTMSLDTTRKDLAYLLGRLFAVFEKTQDDTGGVSNVRDKFFGAACTTPGRVFPVLLKGYQHHLTKATRERGHGMRVNREKLVQEIYEGIDIIPATLGLEDQSLFSVGYYQQRQAFFAKQEAPTAES